jgi:putative restriction endonuclease
MPRRDWTREELIVAFNLYCKIPFSRIHLRNPQVIELAIIGRTPSAVSWKLANFARLDPALQKRNIAGATHGARAEVEIWDEFNNDWEALSFESERLLQQMTGRVVEPIEEESGVFPEGRTRESVVRTRVNQGFSRAVVLAAYGYRCCITGLSLPQLLNASHIVPWSVDAKNRTNPRNGLCLNAIHDRAFDCGLLTVTLDLKVRISPKVKENSSDVAVQDCCLDIEAFPFLSRDTSRQSPNF